jgi:hypothetical protein
VGCEGEEERDSQPMGHRKLFERIRVPEGAAA